MHLSISARGWLAAVLVGTVLPLRAAVCTPDPPPAGDTETTARTRLAAAMPGLLARHRVPAVALALVAGGRPDWSGGFGEAGPPIPDQAARAVTGETLFQAASVSKTIAAVTLLRLVEQGRVDLDRPVESYLGGWRLPSSPDSADGVTLRRVLSHTAGLNMPGYAGFGPGERVQTPRQSLAGAADMGDTPLRIIAPPGATFAYSGGGYTLAQFLLAQVTGESFADFAAAQVLAPLGMEHSAFRNYPSPSPPLTATYEDGGMLTPARGFTALAAAGLETTAADLARFVAALMPGPCGEPPGRGVLSPALIAAMLTPQPHSENDLVLKGSDYGLGIALYRLPGSGRLLAYHPGDNLPNWHSLIALIPERGAGLVVMTDAMGGRWLRVDALCTWLAGLGEGLPAECAEQH